MQKTLDVYQKCPDYTTEHFFIRQVNKSDAEDLLCCYSDLKASEIFNSDNCTSNFVYTNVQDMATCISYWLDEYKKSHYVRFSIIDKSTNKAIGTIEIFNKGTFDDVQNVGILRIDVSSKYENDMYLQEIINVANNHFYEDFGLENIITKAVEDAEQRIEILKYNGYQRINDNKIMPYDNYYIRHLNSIYIKQVTESVAYCGLICKFCHEADKCSGCKSEANCCGRYLSESGCYQYNCCVQKGINGCWECDIAPCDKDMFSQSHDIRNKVFVKCAKKEGVEKLAQYVLNNQLNGIKYGWNKDYDNFGQEEAVFDLLHNGAKSKYKK